MGEFYFGFFEFDLIGLPGSIANSHPIEDPIVFSQLHLHFQHFQVSVFDMVGLADEVLVSLEEVQVVLLHCHTVVCILHLIIKLDRDGIGPVMEGGRKIRAEGGMYLEDDGQDGGGMRCANSVSSRENKNKMQAGKKEKTKGVKYSI